MSELSEEYWKVCDENLVFDSQSANRDNCPYCRNELIRISCPACLENKTNLNTECDYCHDKEKWLRCTKCNKNFN